MAEYLIPSTSLTISEKHQMFAIKNRMLNIPANFPQPNIEHKCICIWQASETKQGSMTIWLQPHECNQVNAAKWMQPIQ